jgi:hypothetical protein
MTGEASMALAANKPEGPCPFCERISAGNVIAGNDSPAALLDGSPLSPGYSLVVPGRHVADFFKLTEREQTDIWSLVSELKARLDREQAPSGSASAPPPGRPCGMPTRTSFRGMPGTSRIRAAGCAG